MIEIKRVIFALLCVFLLNTVSVMAYDNSEFMPYINSCSHIRQFSGDEKDTHSLVFEVLNNHHKFNNLSSLTPSSTQTGALKMCNADFIDDIIFKTFRINTPRPSPEKLTELGYYYNNGFYYYKANTVAQSVTVNEIIKTVTLDDGGVYVIFTDTFTTDTSTVFENSAMKFYHDSSGWYVKTINMGLDFSNLSQHLKTPAPATPYIEFVWNILPLLVFILTVTVAIVILYKFVLF